MKLLNVKLRDFLSREGEREKAFNEKLCHGCKLFGLIASFAFIV